MEFALKLILGLVVGALLGQKEIKKILESFK